MQVPNAGMTQNNNFTISLTIRVSLIKSAPMRKMLILLLASTITAQADNWIDNWTYDASSLVKAVYSDWHHNMPDTGMLPSFASFELTSNMGERHGGSTLGWQQYGLCVPLADPRRSGGAGIMFNASLNADVTFMDADGALHLDKNELYHISLPCAAILPRQNGDTVMFAVSPTLASDFVRNAHCFHVNLLFNYTVKHSETFSYSLGLGYSPEAMVYGIMPFFSFDWQISEDWALSMSAARVSLMRAMNERWEVGVFADVMGGSWAVETDYGTRMLRVRSFVMGATVEYDFSAPGQTKRIVTFSLGGTLATAADICRYNNDRDREVGHHYHPGVFVSGAVDFRF